ncbi:MAG: malectin domain-containing carbohydrate-binding protein [Rhodospirillales bacterium]
MAFAIVNVLAIATALADKSEDSETGALYQMGQAVELRTTAQRASDYVNALGVVYTGGEPQLVADLGVRLVRGDVRRQGSEMYRNLYTLTNGRIKTVALVHPVQQYTCDNNPSRKANRMLPPEKWAAFMDQEILANGTEWIAAFEGPNEFNGQSTRCADPSNDPAVRTQYNPDYADQIREFQKFLYNYIKTVKGLPQPVLGPSIWARSRPFFEESTKKIGNIDSWTDYATFHYYSFNSFPENRMGWYRPTLLNNMYGGMARNKPAYMTETGTCVSTGNAEEIKAKFLTRYQAYFFSFNPMNKTFQYVFSADTDDGCWNLVDLSSGRPLPAWYAMRNVIRILDDGEASFTPGSLNYSLSGDTSDIKTVLLQKKNGAFDLLIWKASRPTDARVPLTLKLPASANVSIYEPANITNIESGDQPLRTVADTKSVPIEVPDHVMIIAIGGDATAATPRHQTAAPASSPAPAAPVAPGPAGGLRIDAGATTTVTTADGQSWSADQSFIGGETVSKPRIPIAGTDDEVLYQTARYGMSGYRLNVPNGTYTVSLHFAEIVPEVKRRDRVFDVTVGGKTLSGIDVLRDAGGRKRALVKTVDGVTVSDGTLSIDFTNTGGGEPPIISAIQVQPR